MIKPKISYINYGMGFTLSEHGKAIEIQLNKNLKKYPKLRKQVLAHEFLHWNSRGWFDDFKIDFYDLFNFKKGREQLSFCIKHPKSLLANSPVFFENGEFIPNWFMVGFWGLISITLITGGLLII